MDKLVFKSWLKLTGLERCAMSVIRGINMAARLMRDANNGKRNLEIEMKVLKHILATMESLEYVVVQFS